MRYLRVDILNGISTLDHAVNNQVILTYPSVNLKNPQNQEFMEKM